MTLTPHPHESKKLGLSCSFSLDHLFRWDVGSNELKKSADVERKCWSSWHKFCPYFHMDDFYQFSVLHGSQVFPHNRSMLDWIVLMMKLCRVDQISQGHALIQPQISACSKTASVFSLSLSMILFSSLPLPFSIHIKILLFCPLDTLSGMLPGTEHSSPHSAKLFQHMFYFKCVTDQPRATVYIGLIHTLNALLDWHQNIEEYCEVSINYEFVFVFLLLGFLFQFTNTIFSTISHTKKQ